MLRGDIHRSEEEDRIENYGYGELGKSRFRNRERKCYRAIEMRMIFLQKRNINDYSSTNEYFMQINKIYRKIMKQNTVTVRLHKSNRKKK